MKNPLRFIGPDLWGFLIFLAVLIGVWAWRVM